METNGMGRVLTEATVENLQDVLDAHRGMMPADQVRRVVVSDALVDTGATSLGLPSRLIRQLGLNQVNEKRVTSTTGGGVVNIYGPVRLTIMGRFLPLDAMELPDDVPVLIGQIPLEYLDLVVDPQQRRLVGNPAHGGEHVLELY
jgi:predicted aspartyl protease